MRTLLLPLLALAATPPEAPPEDALAPGTRVRLTAAAAYQVPGAPELTPGTWRDRFGTLMLPRPGRKLTGHVLAEDEEAITLRLDGETSSVRIPREAIGRVERSRRTTSRGRAIARDAGIGLLAGAAAGTLVGFASGDDKCTEPSSGNPFACILLFSAKEKAAIDAVLMGGLGAVVGAAIGGGRDLDRWHDVGPGALRVGAGPRRGGVAVSLSLRF